MRSWRVERSFATAGTDQVVADGQRLAELHEGGAELGQGAGEPLARGARTSRAATRSARRNAQGGSGSSASGKSASWRASVQGGGDQPPGVARGANIRG
jgi:hypothetical protein